MPNPNLFRPNISKHLAALQDERPNVRIDALRALSKTRNKDVIPYMVKLYDDQNTNVRSEAWLATNKLLGKKPRQASVAIPGLYERYRRGQIKRHICSNGRYLQFVWIKTKDMVDEGLLTWPNANWTPDVSGSERISEDGVNDAGRIVAHWWRPIVVYERLPRMLPDSLQNMEILGYVATEPKEGRIPLYEWIHDFQDVGGDVHQYSYCDAYYATEPMPAIARRRYHSSGIVAYLLLDAAPGFVSLFRGFDNRKRKHVLTTDKNMGSTLGAFTQLGYIKEEAGVGSDFCAPLIHYHFYQEANLYSASVPQEAGAPEFLARIAVAGGGDNPLYEGGLALATFSLEHIHGVSNYSFEYARLLLDFILLSEECDSNGAPTGMLRRSRNPWWHHPIDQESDGQKWAASTDELVGVMVGLHYFLRAAKSDDPLYYERARALLKRIAVYLRDHMWIYADSRITPLTVDRVIEEIKKGQRSIISYGIGTFAFQYPFGQVFKEHLGDTYCLPFYEAKMLALKIASSFTQDWWVNNIIMVYLILIFQTAACAFKVGDWFLETFGIDYPYQDFDFLCGSSISSHKDVYEYILANLYAIQQLKNPPYWNHALANFSVLMVLDTNVTTARERTAIAQRTVRYLYDMMSQGGEDGYYFNGIAEGNLLFAVVARRCYQLLSFDEVCDALNSGRGEETLPFYVRGNNFSNEIDYLLKNIDTNWQKDLPLGEPGFGSPHRPARPWETSWSVRYDPATNRMILWAVPEGRGKNQAWQNPNEDFYAWNRLKGKDVAGCFGETGLYFTDPNAQWSEQITIEKLGQLCRLYMKGTPEYKQLDVGGTSPGLHMKVEYGGNDYLLVRMLLAHFGVAGKPSLDLDQRYAALPSSGEAPW